MSADLLSVLQAINQANYRGMKPTDLCFGTVVQPEPAITIQLEGTMQPIPSAAIVLCDSVRARQTTATDSRGDSVTVTLSEALRRDAPLRAGPALRGPVQGIKETTLWQHFLTSVLRPT